MNIELIQASFITESPLCPYMIPKIRGYLGNQFIHNPMLHNHKEDGYNFAYPLVQYKEINGGFSLIGINQGKEAVWEVVQKTSCFELENQKINIVSKNTKEWQHSLKIIKNYQIYQFITPYLALNDKNHKIFYGLESSIEKKQMLDKILTGNLLTFLKAMGFWVTDKITVDFFLENVKPTLFKGYEFTGLKGEFAANIEIPSLIGLGKSVSRGFGTILCRKDRNQFFR